MTPRLFSAPRAAIDTWRRALAAAREVWEPRRGASASEWCLVTPDGDESGLTEGTPLPLAPAKRFFFPEREVLVRWSGDQIEDALPEPRPFALLGLRACDLSAIAYQDRFFADDAAYRSRREKALLVGWNCRTACSGGFCRDVGTGPFAKPGFDICLTELDDGDFAVEVATPAGEEALAAIAPQFLPRGADLSSLLQRLRSAAEATFPDRPFIARAIARVGANGGGAAPVTTAEWRALGPSCFACTGCTSVCPTCSCFTLVDEATAARDGRGRPLAGERVRQWDSCLLEGFQREASGHHPAPDPGDRVRRFWFHKLSSDFAGFEQIGCVGCGRCDTTCPGSIGALRVMAALGADAPATEPAAPSGPRAGKGS